MSVLTPGVALVVVVESVNMFLITVWQCSFGGHEMVFGLSNPLGVVVRFSFLALHFFMGATFCLLCEYSVGNPLQLVVEFRVYSVGDLLLSTPSRPFFHRNAGAT